MITLFCIDRIVVRPFHFAQDEWFQRLENDFNCSVFVASCSTSKRWTCLVLSTQASTCIGKSISLCWEMDNEDDKQNTRRTETARQLIVTRNGMVCFPSFRVRLAKQELVDLFGNSIIDQAIQAGSSLHQGHHRANLCLMAVHRLAGNC